MTCIDCVGSGNGMENRLQLVKANPWKLRKTTIRYQFQQYRLAMGFDINPATYYLKPDQKRVPLTALALKLKWILKKI
jgi:hypothetical protein